MKDKKNNGSSIGYLGMFGRSSILVLFALITQISYAGKTSDSLRITARVMEVCEISSDPTQTQSAASSDNQMQANWSCSHQTKPVMSLTDDSYHRIVDEDFQGKITSINNSNETYTVSNLPGVSSFTLEF